MLVIGRDTASAGSGLGTRGSVSTFETVTVGIWTSSCRVCGATAFPCTRIFPEPDGPDDCAGGAAGTNSVTRARARHNEPGVLFYAVSLSVQQAGEHLRQSGGFFVGDPGGELTLDAGDVHDRRALQRGPAGSGHPDQHAPAVVRIGQPLDQALVLHPGDLAGQARLGEQHPFDQIAEPEPPAGLAQLHQDVIGVQRNLAGIVELLAQPLHRSGLGRQQPGPRRLAIPFETTRTHGFRPPDGASTSPIAAGPDPPRPTFEP